MCRHCKHPDLQMVREAVERQYHPVAVFGGDRKAALKSISAAVHEKKSEAKQARRDHAPTYRVDYEQSILSFAALVLNSADGWDNGGNYFL